MWYALSRSTRRFDPSRAFFSYCIVVLFCTTEGRPYWGQNNLLIWNKLADMHGLFWAKSMVSCPLSAYETLQMVTILGSVFIVIHNVI